MAVLVWALFIHVRIIFLCDFEKVRLYETEKLFNQGDFIHRYQRS
jgi:hypothetical protein